MRRKNVTNQVIRESITKALLLLMQDTPFRQITITALVEKAGVSRVSFYRNFQDKESVLVGYLNDQAAKWWESFRASGSGDVVQGVFQHCLEVGGLARMLYEQGLVHLLLENVNDCLGVHQVESEGELYLKACFAGSVFGVLNEWVRRGMSDPPEKMAALLAGYQQEIAPMIQGLLARL